MNRSSLAGMDFSRLQRWLDRALGDGVLFLVLDAACAAIWAKAAPVPAGLTAALTALGKPDTGSVHLFHLEQHLSVLCRPIRDNLDQHCGWGCLGYDPVALEAQPARLDDLADAFNDALDAIDAEHIQCIGLDMMSEELGSRYEELHLIYSVDKHFRSHGGDYKKAFQGILESTVAHLDVEVASFVSPGTAENYHACGPGAPAHPLGRVLEQISGDLFRFVQASGESLVLNQADDPIRGYVFTNLPYKVLATPVRTDNAMDAMTVLLRNQRQPDFTNSDRRLAQVLANQLASLGLAYRLVRTVNDFNAQIARALIEAVEAKDPYTRGHSDRVNFIALEIGRRMGLSGTDIDDLNWGSLLHDVGKIGIPDAILGKPQTLAEDEYTFVRIHPERSYEILKPMKQLRVAATAARHHHEWFDGKGYPHGLRGERIPLLSRIIAVADTYDSITSSRAYRPGRSHAAAMQELERIAGQQLDPAVVEVMVQLLGEQPGLLDNLHLPR